MGRRGPAAGSGAECSSASWDLLKEVAINPTIELPELTQDWEIDSWRAQQNLVHQDPGQRNSDPTGDCPGLACGCPGISGEGVGQGWPAAGLGAQTVAVHAWDLFREVNIIFITSTIVWSQVNSREGTQLYPSIENWIKDLLSKNPDAGLPL